MSAAPMESTAQAWRDPKRYAWLLGLFVPTLPFLAWGLVQPTGLGVFWFYGPVLVFAVFPPLDLALGMDSTNPPDGVIKWLEQDRYYRWCTYLYLPDPVRRPGVRVLAVVARTPLGGGQTSAWR